MDSKYVWMGMGGTERKGTKQLSVDGRAWTVIHTGHLSGKLGHPHLGTLFNSFLTSFVCQPCTTMLAAAVGLCGCGAEASHEVFHGVSHKKVHRV